MRYILLLFIGILSFVIALNATAIRAVVAIFLCSLLGICFSASTDFSVLSHMNSAQASVSFDLEGQEVAVPPIIREAPIDLQSSLANDFVVSRQTPYDSGRNEVLIVSPSTGTEQRFEINLPTGDGFRLYEASFDKVRIDDASKITESSNPKEVETALENFSMSFNDDNLLSKVTLADGSRAEFSGSEVLIYASNGEKIEQLQPSQGVLSEGIGLFSSKSSFNLQETFIAQASSCESGIRNRIYTASQDVGRKSNILRGANSIQGKAASWASAFGERALEDSLVSETRNQTLQEIACVPPVECDERQEYEGASEIRTDLFRIPGSSSQQVDIDYEFYEIPDRMEIYYQGELVDSIPRGGGQTSGSSQRLVDLPGGAAFVGVKLVGNEDDNTRWNYTISCSGTQPCREDIERDGDGRRLLATGTWTGRDSLTIEGGQVMHFVIKNVNVLGATVGVTSFIDNRVLRTTKRAIIPPLGSADMSFSMFGKQPIGWRFSIETPNDNSIVTWKLYSTWLPCDGEE